MATSLVLNPLDPAGSQLEQMSIDRQRALATALQQQGLTAPQGEMIAGRYVGPAATQYLGKIAQSLSGKQMNDALDKRQLDYQRNAMQMMTDYLRGGNGSSQSTAVQPQTTPLAMPLGSGMSGVGAPASTSATPASAAPAASFAGGPDYMKARIIASLYGNEAAKSYLDRYAPTDFMKTLTAAGIDPQSPQGRQLLQKNINKLNYIAPLNARPDSIIRDPLNSMPIAFNPKIPDGGTPVFDASGNVIGVRPLNGVTDIVANMERAKTAGQGSVIPYTGFDANGNPLPVTNRTTAATQGSVPNAGFPAGTQVPGPGVDNSGRLPILQQERANIAAQPDSPRKAADLAAIDREIARVGGAASAQASSAIYGTQAPGVVRGAEAAASNMQNELSKKWTDLSAQNQQAQTANSYLENIATLAQKAAVGPASDKLNYINGLLSLAGNEKATDARTANDLLNKYSSQIVSRLGQGGLGTDAARTILQAAYPSAHMTGDAIQEAVRNIKGANSMIQAKTRLLAPLANSRSAQEYNNKEILFDQNADPRIWEYQQITDPAKRQAFARQVLQQDPQFPQKIKTLESLGVLQ